MLLRALPLVAVLGVTAGSIPLPGETKLLEGFTLIDGTGKAPVPDAALLLVDGRIRYAGPKAGMPAVATLDERVSLIGRFVMPGIINLHCHLGNVVGLVQDPGNFTRANVEKQLRTYSSYGVTSVLSMGSDQPLIFAMRAEQRAGRPRMARIFTAGRGFTGKAGYPTSAPGMKGVPYEVTTAAEAERFVADNAANQVDIIKIWVDDHLGKEQKIPLALSAAIIQAATRRGLRVAAHIFYLDDAKGLVNAGLYGLAHSVRDKPVDEALIAAMKRKGAWQAAATLTREISTFIYAQSPAFLSDAFFTRSVEPQVIDAVRAPAFVSRLKGDPDLPKYPGFLATAQKNLKRLADAGVKFGFGTDTGPPARFSGYFEHWEMELMAEAGLTPSQIIQAATANSAEFLGVSRDLGTLQPGRWGDFVVLKADPLSQIRNTRQIEAVWIAGNQVH